MKTLLIILATLNVYGAAEKENLFCPGTFLTLSCGDRKCEPKKGETATSCPSDCVDALVRSYNQQTLCTQVKNKFEPTTELEISEILKEAHKNNQKVRVVGALHSANSQVCTDGVVISTEKLRKIHGIRKVGNQEIVDVDSGVTLWELTEWLHTKGRALGFTIMGYRVGSIGGLIATGSHGSSPKHTAVISSLVESLRVVNASGDVEEISSKTVSPDVLKAFKAHLGVLGVVSQVSLKIQPQFNLSVDTSMHSDSKLFKDGGALSMVAECDYGQINWFPGAGKFLKTCGIKSLEPADKGAENVLLNPELPSIAVGPMKMIMQDGACRPKTMCFLEKARVNLYKNSPPFVKTGFFGKPVNSNHVVGPSHRMMSSVLTPHQSGFFQMDWEIVIPQQNITAALKAVKALTKKYGTCLPLVGVFIRFAPAEDETLLAHSVSEGEFHSGETAAFIEMPVYVPTGLPVEMMKKYEKPFEEFARMLVEDFGGRPHWGKNKEWLFALQRDKNKYGPRLERFQTVLDQYDPQRIFANSFGALVGLK